ncbi:MAG: pantothenate synthase [Sclerophora amabilis]|nr:MAG: pantothenate synthase [Sclerophora amabilis]
MDSSAVDGPSSTPVAAVTTNPFEIFRDISPIREFRRGLLRADRSVGLVPTLGALHAGHFSLIRQAARENTDVVVSIYLNPTQFGANEDFDSYPKTWEEDLRALRELDEEFATSTATSPFPPTSTLPDISSSVAATSSSSAEVGREHGNGEPRLGRISAVFAPTTTTMYPTLPPSSDPVGHGSFVTITPLASLLEGASRPVFFRGVATVCMKLFNIVTPDRVYFGQKDIQQTVVIRRMVKDMCVGTDVRVGPTMRDPHDGLALSSRNVYLGRRRRRMATVLAEALQLAEARYVEGLKCGRDDVLGPARDLAESTAREQEHPLPPSERARFKVDYLSLADPESLEELDEVDPSRGAIVSGAIKMMPVEEPQPGEDCGVGGGVTTVRLIDNIILNPRESA